MGLKLNIFAIGHLYSWEPLDDLGSLDMHARIRSLIALLPMTDQLYYVRTNATL